MPKVKRKRSVPPSGDDKFVSTDSLLNANVFSANGVKEAKKQYQTNSYPFPHACVDNVFSTTFLQQVKESLLKQQFYDKKNDLYDFQQTDSLTKITNGVIADLRKSIYSPKFREWMEHVTNIQLNDTIDISAAIYTDSSYLLCHDDDLSERRIAYIIYLVPDDWDASDGGALDLYKSDDTGAPDAIVKSISPVFNRMAFFEVSHLSHHQVAEVLDASKGPRLSISGWFHGEPITRPAPALPDAPVFINQIPLRDTDLTEWINPMYLRPSVIPQMQQQFVSSASLELEEFLLPHKYTAITMAMGVQRWHYVKPANLRHFRVSTSGGLGPCDEDPAEEELTLNDLDAATLNGTIPDAVAQFVRFVRSDLFQTYIHLITGTEVDAVACEARCFSHRDYSMICDLSHFKSRVAAKRSRILKNSDEPVSATNDITNNGASSHATIDATWCFVHQDEWDLEDGGYTTFLTEDEELLTVAAKKNALSIVMKEKGIMSFVKYINHKAIENRYDVNAQFRVTATTEDGDKSDSD